jgi:hypothetical protein
VTTAAEARAGAHDWVMTVARETPGYRAAFIAGSVAGQRDDEPVSPGSDTDVMVVLDGEPAGKAGKFHHQGVLLEGTFLGRADLDDTEALLASYHGANALATGLLLDDPTGLLAGAMGRVRREFPRRPRVEARVAGAASSVVAGFAAMDETKSLAERAQGWVFPTGVMTHVLLVAGLRNPTVRRRYETTRDLLAEHDRLDLHEQLLDVLGSRKMSPGQAGRHLDAIARIYDAAIPVPGGSYRFASDVSDISRPIAIDGSRDMIARGSHREAAFWLVVTGSRALQKLAHGVGPEAAAPWEGAYAELLADLGVASFAAMCERRDQALALLPEVRSAAAAIIDATPEIVDA